MHYKDIAPEISAIAKRYDYHQPPDLLIKLQELVDKIWRLIVDLLNSFKIRIPGATNSSLVGNVLQVVVVVVGVICLLAIVYYTWKRVAQLSQAEQKTSRGSAVSGVVLDFAGWKEEAAELARQSNWREACRAIYMAALRLLDESKIFEFAPTRTNYEYWYALSPRSKPLAVTFRKLSQIVEEIWFGNLDAEKGEYEECLQALRDLEVESAVVTKLEAENNRDRVAIK